MDRIHNSGETPGVANKYALWDCLSQKIKFIKFIFMQSDHVYLLGSSSIQVKKKNTLFWQSLSKPVEQLFTSVK